MGDKSFERIECSEKWVCNEAQTAQFGDEFTLVRRKRLAQFAGCICEEAKAAFSGFCWIFLANRSCRSVSGIGEELLRSEEHTSELQSLMRISYAVFCLKKKIRLTTNITNEMTRVS